MLAGKNVAFSTKRRGSGHHLMNSPDWDDHSAFQDDPFLGNGPDSGFNLLKSLIVREKDLHFRMIDIPQDKGAVQFHSSLTSFLQRFENIVFRKAQVTDVLFVNDHGGVGCSCVHGRWVCPKDSFGVCALVYFLFQPSLRSATAECILSKKRAQFQVNSCLYEYNPNEVMSQGSPTAVFSTACRVLSPFACQCEIHFRLFR